MNTKITASLIGMVVLVIVGISVLVASGIQNESSSDSEVNDDSSIEEQSKSRNDFSDQRGQTQSVQETFREIPAIQEQIASEREGAYEAGNQLVSVLDVQAQYGICQQSESCNQNDARLGTLEERVQNQDPSAEIIVDTGENEKSYVAVL
ncbi:MAG: hypothetical protein ABEI13_02750, partial [Candidatus Paceibacteria bacterium]